MGTVVVEVHIFDIALFIGLIPVYYHNVVYTFDNTGRILFIYTLQDLINTVWRQPVILDRCRRFLDMLKTLPFSCILLARSLPINKNQRTTVLCLIFAFLSCLIVKTPNSF